MEIRGSRNPRDGAQQLNSAAVRLLNLPARCRDRSLNSAEQIPAFALGNDGMDSRVMRSPLQSLQIQYREHNDRHRSVQARHHPRNLYAVDVRHRQVQQHQVRSQFLKFFDPRPSAFRFPAYRPLPRTHDGI